MLSNAGSKDNGVKAIHTGSECPHEFCDFMAIVRNGQFGAGVPVVRLAFNIPHIVTDTTEAEQSGRSTELCEQIVYRMAFLQQKWDNIRVNISATVCVRNTTLQRKAETSIYGYAVFYCADR